MESIDNFSKEFLQKLKYVYDFNSMISYFPDYKSKLLYVNNILFEINQFMLSFINNPKEKIKFVYYSAHDDNMNAMLALLGVKEP